MCPRSRGLARTDIRTEARGIFVEKNAPGEEIDKMRLEFAAAALFITFGLPASLQAAIPTYTVEEAVALAQAQNPEIAIARKQVQAERGGLIEVRSCYLPSVASTGLLVI